ncbi:hypothetical protein EJB05_14489, partial [Eragrostis curvula]
MPSSAPKELTNPPPRSLRTLTASGPTPSSPAATRGASATTPTGGSPATPTPAASVYLWMDDASAGAGALVAGNVRVEECKFMLHEVGGGPPRCVSSPTLAGVFVKPQTGLGLPRFPALEDQDEWKSLIKHDRFTIRCDFAVVPPSSHLPSTSAKAMAPPPSAPPEPHATALPSGSGLLADLGSLLETKEGADVDFEVCGELFAAHKLVRAARSPVFKADFFGPAKEESTSYIRIGEMNPEAFKALLHYMYTDTLPETMPLNSREEGAVLAEGLLSAADRYELKELKLIIEDKMCKNIDVSTVLLMLALAEQHQCGKLKKMCLELVASNKNTRATMALDDVERLARSHPSIVKEVITKILDVREREAVENVDWVSFSIEATATTPEPPPRRLLLAPPPFPRACASLVVKKDDDLDEEGAFARASCSAQASSHRQPLLLLPGAEASPAASIPPERASPAPSIPPEQARPAAASIPPELASMPRRFGGGGARRAPPPLPRRFQPSSSSSGVDSSFSDDDESRPAPSKPEHRDPLLWRELAQPRRCQPALLASPRRGGRRPVRGAQPHGALLGHARRRGGSRRHGFTAASLLGLPRRGSSLGPCAAAPFPRRGQAAKSVWGERRVEQRLQQEEEEKDAVQQEEGQLVQIRRRI